MKEAKVAGGLEALLKWDRRRANLKRRVDEVVEEEVLAFARENPVVGQVRVSNELRKRSLHVSPTGVRSVWLRQGLQTEVAPEDWTVLRGRISGALRFTQPRRAAWHLSTRHRACAGPERYAVVGFEEVDEASEVAARLADGVIGVQVNLFVFDRAPQPFDEDVVAPAAATVHADAHLVGLQGCDEPGLGALVGVKDLRAAKAGQCLLQGIDAKVRCERIGEPPGEDLADEAVDDGH